MKLTLAAVLALALSASAAISNAVVPDTLVTGDTLDITWHSARDTTYLYLIIDNGDAALDTADDIVFYRIMIVDNGTERTDIDHLALMPDADPAPNGYRLVGPDANLPVARFWFLIFDRDDSYAALTTVILPGPVVRTISGTVLAADSEDVSALSVLAMDTLEDLRREYFTDSSGNFTLQIDSALFAATGGWILVAARGDRLPAGYVLLEADTTVDVNAGSVTGVNFQIERLFSGIEITCNAGGSPLSNVEFWLEDSFSSNMEPATWARTGSNGVCSAYVDPGVYRVHSYDYSVGEYLVPTDPVYVHVLADSLSPVTVTFTVPDTFIYGRITQDGQALSGAHFELGLRALDQTFEAQTESDTNGLFRLPALASIDSYIVWVQTHDEYYDSLPAGWGWENGDQIILALGDSAIFNMIDLGVAAKARGAQAHAFALNAPAPNPFRPQAAITYSTPRETRVSIRVYDLSGRLVCTLADGVRPAGAGTVVWRGLDDRGRALAGGVYVCRMQAGTFRAERKMVLVK